MLTKSSIVGRLWMKYVPYTMFFDILELTLSLSGYERSTMTRRALSPLFGRVMRGDKVNGLASIGPSMAPACISVYK